jgi:hypothetical protein
MLASRRKVAQIDATRKLLLIVHVMYKSGEDYHAQTIEESWHPAQYLTVVMP